MEPENSDTDCTFPKIIEACQQTRRYEGTLNGFWQKFLKSCVQLVSAEFGAVTVYQKDRIIWNTFCHFPTSSKDKICTLNLVQYLTDLSMTAVQEGHAHMPVKTEQGVLVLLAVHLDLPEHEPPSVVLVAIKALNEDQLAEVVTLLHMMAGTPRNYLIKAGLQQARIDVVRFSEAMDLAIQMNLQKRYVGAAMALQQIYEKTKSVSQEELSRLELEMEQARENLRGLENAVKGKKIEFEIANAVCDPKCVRTAISGINTELMVSTGESYEVPNPVLRMVSSDTCLFVCNI